MQPSRNHVFLPAITFRTAYFFEMIGLSAMKTFLAKCWTRRRRPRRSVQTVDPQDPIGQDEDLFVIDAITFKPGKKSEIYCTMEINGQPVEIKIDTGAKCNVITLDIFRRISHNEKIDKTKAVQLVAYGGDTLTTLGSVNLEVRLPSISRNLEFHVIDKPVTPLLGTLGNSTRGILE